MLNASLNIFSFYEEENQQFIDNTMRFNSLTPEQLDAQMREKEIHDAVLFGGITVLLLFIVIFRKKVLSLLKRVTNLLDTPVKRVGIICLLFGCVLMVTGVAQLGFYRFDSDSFVHSITLDARRHSSTVFGLGFYLTIFGFLLSFLYDQTVVPILRWVKKGNSTH
ncbi:hypothetical protein OP862_14640 [Yersinia massiliensis]|uniref:hypothetical protein n=1 Tax=Yersinia massiliensis TaxID=419257 RepID=UPI00223F74D7|nr:hypothetical protein [Yersinia massiliensis]MDA5547372.1 hypothetical protein [Yersinia massiliensis]UZM77793.1 hypothetical protein OP862_14640 [Yersinia massiliensis]